MKFKYVFAVLLIFSLSAFAQQNGKGGKYLAFSEGSNNLAVGFLAGWNHGEGFGVPLIYDHSAFGGMFSFGGEFRAWGAKYTQNWYNYYWYNGHGYGLSFHHSQYDPNSGAWLYDEYGYYDSHNNYVPVYRQMNGGAYVYVNPNGTNGEAYNPYSGGKQLRKFGWSPMFRFMFHPFGIPALKGQVKVANVLDPYVGLKFGFSVINYDKDDPFNQGDAHRYVDFPAWNGVLGLRWYFKENIALQTELSVYDFTLGINFKF